MALSFSFLKNERARIALFFAAGLVALTLAYFTFFRRDYVVLYRDLAPADAAMLVAELDNQNVPYRLGGDGSQILVPVERAETARIDIANAELSLSGVDGFELFNDADMGLTDFAQKIKYQRAIQGELARTIMTLEGVVDARVHVSIPERALFRAERQQAEAAITLVTRDGQALSPARVEGVQRLIAAAVPDLDVADVVVLNAAGELLSEAAAAAPAPQMMLAEINDPLAEAIRRTLPGQAVEISVEQRRPPGALAGAENIENAPAPTEIVHISTARQLSDVEQRNVRSALYGLNLEGRAIEAVAFHTGAASALEVGREAHREAAVDPAPTRSGERSEGAAQAPASPITIALAIALVGAALIAAFLLMIRQSARLSADEHVDFAERLRRRLSIEEDANGAR